MTLEELKQLLKQQPLVGSDAANEITDEIINKANKMRDARLVLDRKVAELQIPVDEQVKRIKAQIDALYNEFNNSPVIKALKGQIVDLQVNEDKTRSEVIKYHKSASYPYGYNNHPLAPYVRDWEEKVKNALRELYPNTNFNKLWSHCEDYAEPDRDTWDNEEIDGSRFINQVRMYIDIHKCLEDNNNDEDEYDE